MSEGSEEELPGGEVNENQSGLILGCWDHEKTATLIEDLEHSVNLVERKCVQLFQELIHYKKYLEESGRGNCNFTFSKKKTKRPKNSHCFSGSVQDMVFGKNFINFQDKEVHKIFEEKFKAKLYNINKELREAAHKIGLKDNIILLHANDYLKALSAESGEKINCQVPEKLLRLGFVNPQTKSDSTSMGAEEDEGEEEESEEEEKEEEEEEEEEEEADEGEFSRITRNELELYQKLSRLNMKRRKRKKKTKGRKLKFCLKRKSPRRRQDFSTSKTESKKQKSSKKKSRKGKRKKATVPRRSRSHSPRDFCSAQYSRENLNEAEVEKMCKSLNKVLCAGKPQKSGGASKGQEPPGEEEVMTLGAAVRKAVPFTACASTSKSHNLGLNIQQLLFLSKQRQNGKASAPEKSHGDGKTQTAESGEEAGSKKSENGPEKRSAPSWTADSKNRGFENDEVGHTESKGKIWTSEHDKSGSRKVRSKYTNSDRGTGNSPEGFLEYHKSSMSQYTNGRKSTIKSESKRAFAVGSKIMVSDCRRTDVFEVLEGKGGFENPSGDRVFNEEGARPSTQWSKAYNSFLGVFRKYESLKEKLTGDHSELTDVQLECLESEIDDSIAKYKDFVQFYGEFLLLNHRFKFQKTGCRSKAFGPEASYSADFRRKFTSYRPTYSTTVKKAFREVQALQEQIRLVNA